MALNGATEQADNEPAGPSTPGGSTGSDGHGALSWPERRFQFSLALPAFGIALAYTLVSTYAPVLINELSGPAVTGLLIGGEGLFALLIPMLAGGRSDKLDTRLGGRVPLILGGGVLAVIALILLPLAAGSIALLAAALAVFFVGYFTYYTPYYALYPDLVPHRARGRSLGFQGTLRSAGMLTGLGSGGYLLSLWQPLPFTVGAVAMTVFTAGLYFAIRGRRWGRQDRQDKQRSSTHSGFRAGLSLLQRDRRIRAWFFGNACWEGAVAALRTFAVLYFTVGLGLSLRGASSVLVVVGIGAILAAPAAGKLADKYGHRRVMRLGLWVFALGLAPALITTSTAFAIAIVPVAFAAVVLMTLPYALLMGLLPEREEHGVGAGLFGMSRGIGVLSGALLAGFATDLMENVSVLTFEETQGYSAIFVVAATLLLASRPLLRRTA